MINGSPDLGSVVKKGQLLFEIEPRPFQAMLDRAEGQLAEPKAQLPQDQAQLATTEADQVKSQLDVDKYTPLAKAEAASQQDLDNRFAAYLRGRWCGLWLRQPVVPALP